MKTPLLFLVKPLLGLSSRVLMRPRKLLDRCSIYFKGNIPNELIVKLIPPFQKIDQKIKAKGIGGYIREAIRVRPIIFPTLGWTQLFGYYIYRSSRRCIKVTCRYIKKTLRWGFYYPAEKGGYLFYGKLKLFLMILHRPFSFLDYYYRSIKLVREEPADIYHAHDLNTLPVAFWAKKRTKGKLVYDSHELFLNRNTTMKQSRLNKWLLSRLESFLIKSTDDVITVCESIGLTLKERYSPKRLSVVLNAPLRKVINNFVSLHEELRIPQSDRIIIYVGNVTYNRGLEELIQSITYLQSCVMVIMGHVSNAEYKANLIQLAKNFGVEHSVRFFGPVPGEEIIAYASSASIGVIPIKNACLSYYYCLPNKLFECISSGLPIVGSDFPELRKVIEGYNLGKTFNPEDPRDIADAINYVLSDEERYNEMKRNASQAAKVFNWENESKKLLEIYKRLENEIISISN